MQVHLCDADSHVRPKTEHRLQLFVCVSKSMGSSLEQALAHTAAATPRIDWAASGAADCTSCYRSMDALPCMPSTPCRCGCIRCG